MEEKKLMTKNSRLQFIVLLLILLASVSPATSSLARQTENADAGSSSKEVERLLRIVRDEQLQENDNERVVIAIRRLGEIRATSAIDDLVQLLTFKRILGGVMKTNDVAISFQPETIFGRYPATEALYQIGKSTLPALVKVIEAEEADSRASENAAYIVAQIFRDVPSKGIKYLEEAAAKSSSTIAAQRLSYAAQKLTELTQRQ